VNTHRSTQELSWLQNNSIFLNSIVNLERNKQNSHHLTFYLKNETDSNKNWQFTVRRQKFHNMGMDSTAILYNDPIVSLRVLKNECILVEYLMKK
jgi:hypothetical protein